MNIATVKFETSAKAYKVVRLTVKKAGKVRQVWKCACSAERKGHRCPHKALVFKTIKLWTWNRKRRPNNVDERVKFTAAGQRFMRK